MTDLLDLVSASVVKRQSQAQCGRLRDDEWLVVTGFPPRLLTRSLRLVIVQELLRRLLELLQQSPMIAGLINGGLQLFA